MGSLVKPSSLLRSNMAVTALLITLCLFAASSAEPEAEAIAAADPGYFHHGYHGYHHLGHHGYYGHGYHYGKRAAEPGYHFHGYHHGYHHPYHYGYHGYHYGKRSAEPGYHGYLTTDMDITDTITMDI